MIEQKLIPDIVDAYNSRAYLIKKYRCILCPKPIGNASKDHIFPGSVCKAHPLILGSIIDNDYNFAPLCRSHHDSVDFDPDRKFDNYGSGDLLGLTRWILDKYPRAVDTKRRIVQEAQLLRLASKLKINIKRLNGQKTSEYQSIEELIETYFFKWQLQGLTRINFLDTTN
jgi:hypothetical protein